MGVKIERIEKGKHVGLLTLGHFDQAAGLVNKGNNKLTQNHDRIRQATQGHKKYMLP